MSSSGERGELSESLGDRTKRLCPSALWSVWATRFGVVQGRFVGAARVLAMRPAKVKPGKHRLTVEASGFFPHDAELQLPPGVTTVDLKLRPVPP